MKNSKIIEVTKKDNYTKVIFETPKGKQFDFEIWYHKKTNSAGMARNNIDYAGLWFEGKKLVDYDMVFELSKNAIRAIRKAGFVVPREYEPNRPLILKK